MLGVVDRLGWPGVGLGRGELAKSTMRPGRIVAPKLLGRHRRRRTAGPGRHGHPVLHRRIGPGPVMFGAMTARKCEPFAGIIQRPMASGHLGEWVASRIFDIELAAVAVEPGFDGRFRSRPDARATSGLSSAVPCVG